MVRRTWTKEDTCALIEAYEKNPTLWNIKCKEYRNRELKNDVLSKIALQFHSTKEEIQRKLHNLRNQVSQELNKIKKKKSGSGTDEVYKSNWPYFSALQFLIPGLVNRSTTSNIADEDADAHGDDGNNAETQQTEKNMDDRSQHPLEHETIEKTGSKRKSNVNAKSDDDHSKVLKRALEIMQKEPDENDRFGEYVAMELKSLRFDSNRRRLKSEIRRAIARIADEDDTNDSTSVSIVPSPYPSPQLYHAPCPSPYSVPSPSPSPSSITHPQLAGIFTQDMIHQYNQTSTSNMTFDKQTDFLQL